ncbi:M13-type metalloendopeptidase [Rhodanobacter sp. MP7CTX1]|uniref:M13 family metallopeptidase n=1 Tax=Rhodanobacter sp. MP7CTX1 TaxID=2723084 RepID=UPI00161C462E|nr:M13-type metalloendopeptidase [Rhodanobacter sp. MP7CTX1]MBB6187517.1 putative endopeptidase [Rhodanobacter sp. MP7CTX1]
MSFVGPGVAVLSAPAAALTAPSAGTSGIDESGMDRSVAPGNDFYRFANGRWLDTASIPRDKTDIGVFDQVHDVISRRNYDILEQAKRDPSSKIGAFYASFMDEAAANANGIKPIQPTLNAILQAKDKRELAVVMAGLQHLGVDGLINLGIEIDDAHPKAYTVTLAQPALGLPSKDYYLLPDARLKQTRDAYRAYLSRLLVLAGQPNAQPRAQSVFELEKSMASPELDRAAAHEATAIYHPVTPAQLPQNAPGMDWRVYLDALGVGAETRFVVRHPAPVAAMAKLWNSAPLPILKDWLYVHTLDHYAPFLSSPFVDAQFDFSGRALSGAQELRPRWQRGVSLISHRMGDALGKVYVARYFPPSAKAEGEQLAASILAAYRVRIEKNVWMAPDTKAKALQKLSSLKPMVGYPDKWRDYSGLVVKRGDLTGNVDRAESFDYDHELAKLGTIVDRGEWMLPPTTPGGWANPVSRVIVFPAASLQQPIFDPDADPAVNYGALGVIMGHEFSHQFDDNGRHYDANGKLADWWTKDDSLRFNAAADRLVAQYDHYEPLPGVHAKGRATLNENIADLGGLVISHDAYIQSLAGKPAPLIGGLTGEQRFFLSYAQMSRSKGHDDALRQQILGDEHSIDPLRVYSMRNIDAWYSAFSVNPGQKLYLRPIDRVNIW